MKGHLDAVKDDSNPYEEIFNNTYQFTGLMDTDGTLIEANDTALEFGGISRDDVIGKKIWNTDWFRISNETQEQTKADVHRAAAGEFVRRELEVQGANGSTIIDFSIRPITDDDGNIMLLVPEGRDISDLKERERRLELLTEGLQEKTSHLDAILECTTRPLFMKAASGEYLFANREYQQLFDLQEDEIIGRTDHDLHPEKVADDVWANDRQVLETEQPVEREERVIVNGEERIYLSLKVPVYFDDESDEPDAVFGMATDITERKEREQKLELVETLFEHAEECQFIVDVVEGEFGLRHANTYYKRTVGLSPGEPVTGQTPTELFGEAGGQEILDRYRECVETRESITYTVEVPVPEEGTVYRTILAPVVTDGEVTHIVGTARDITDHKHREEKLKRQNNQLEEFASIVSHDLRNPMRVAEGRLELLREECESNHIDDVAQALDRMDALIEDLLTLAREGVQVGEVESVVLADLITDCWQHVAASDAEIVTTIDRTVRADRSRLQQLLENLFRNAVEHGGENVTVTIGDVDTGFFIEDDGSGIPEQDRDDVFEAGYSTSSEGTGFGLRIVKQVADAHGWDIAVSEGEQGGARFEITGVEFADR